MTAREITLQCFRADGIVWPPCVNCGGRQIAASTMMAAAFTCSTGLLRKTRAGRPADHTAACRRGPATLKAALRDYQAEVAAGLESVRKACRLCEMVSQNQQSGDNMKKVDGSAVTVADIAIQAMIVLELSRLFPGDSFLSEEDSEMIRASPTLFDRVHQLVAEIRPGVSRDDILKAIDCCERKVGDQDGRRLWVLDPIDGTRGFVNGWCFCIALGLYEPKSNGFVVSVLGMPGSDPEVQLKPGILTAVAGHGTELYTLDGKPRQNATKGSRGSKNRADHWTFSGRGFPSSSQGRAPVRLCCGSQVKYYAVATGCVSCFVQSGGCMVYTWDHAAGILAVQESGGCVTDIENSALPMNSDLKFRLDSAIVATASHSDHDAFRQRAAQTLNLL